MKRFARWTFYTLAGLLLLLAVGGLAGYAYLRANLPRHEGEIALPALDAPVTVDRDSRGIPTIRAESTRDAHMALGFLHAQDRLWQMDFTRRTVAGRLSEVVGPPTLGVDRFMRILDLRGRAEEQHGRLAPSTRAALSAYSAGVNAYLDRDPVLPLEFHLLRDTPARWTPTDSLSWMQLMALQLSGNWRREIAHARVAERLDNSQIKDWYGPETKEPATIDRWREAARGLPWRALAQLVPPELTSKSASNAWVLDGRQTQSGAPILANDPHLGLSAPGTWYLARIETPDRTLVGATAPGLPFMILGRNDDVAWGLTTTHSDTQDLFIETLDPNDPERYLTPGGSKPFQVRNETIPVAYRSTPETLTVRHTRHGPVLSDALDSAGHLVEGADNKVVALAWSALRDEDRTLDAIRAVNRAGSVAEAMRAFDKVGSPQQNIHLADTQGNIAVAAPGRVPVRQAGDGRLPVPGKDGAFDWTGTIPHAALPRQVNPADGRIVNANNRLVPPDYPHLLTARWRPPHRARRIESLLDADKAPHTLAASQAIQLDVNSAAARIVLPTLLDRVAPDSPRSEAAVARLKDWDGTMARNRPEPLIFVAWLDRVNRALFADELGPAFDTATRPDPARIRRILRDSPAWCDDIRTETRRETCAARLTQALDGALGSLGEAYGADMDAWRWGDSHRADLGHPLLSRLPVLGGLFGVGLGTPGGDETVNRGGATYTDGDVTAYRHVLGPGLRALHDLGQPPASSRFMIADGPSGNPLSPHYGALAETWRDGGYVKLVGETQEKGARLRLTPGTP